MTSEARLKKQVAAYLGERGYTYHPQVTGMFYTANGTPISIGTRGTADHLYIQPETGRAVWIETKVRPRKPTPEQLNFISVMRRQGCIAGVVYEIKDLEELLI